MKLPSLPIVLFLFSPATAAHSSRRHRRTLSATAKKPASLAGFLYLRLSKMLSKTPLAGSFPPAAPLSRSPRSLHLIIQTPNSL